MKLKFALCYQFISQLFQFKIAAVKSYYHFYLDYKRKKQEVQKIVIKNSKTIVQIRKIKIIQKIQYKYQDYIERKKKNLRKQYRMVSSRR